MYFIIKKYLQTAYDIIYSYSGTCAILAFWIGANAYIDSAFALEYGYYFPYHICSSLFIVHIPVNFHAECLTVVPYVILLSEFIILTPLMFIHKASHLIFALYQCRKPFKDESNGFDYRKAKQLLCIFFSYSELIRNVASLVKDRKRLMHVARCIFKCWLVLLLYVLIIRLCFR